MKQNLKLDWKTRIKKLFQKWFFFYFGKKFVKSSKWWFFVESSLSFLSVFYKNRERPIPIIEEEMGADNSCATLSNMKIKTTEGFYKSKMKARNLQKRESTW